MQILYACGRSIARISEHMAFGALVMVNAFKMEIQSLRSELKDSYFAVWLSNSGVWVRT